VSHHCCAPGSLASDGPAGRCCCGRRWRACAPGLCWGPSAGRGSISDMPAAGRGVPWCAVVGCSGACWGCVWLAGFRWRKPSCEAETPAGAAAAAAAAATAAVSSRHNASHGGGGGQGRYLQQVKLACIAVVLHAPKSATDLVPEACGSATPP
jgi:hypothetical protein